MHSHQITPCASIIPLVMSSNSCYERTEFLRCCQRSKDLEGHSALQLEKLPINKSACCCFIVKLVIVKLEYLASIYDHIIKKKIKNFLFLSPFLPPYLILHSIQAWVLFPSVLCYKKALTLFSSTAYRL